MLEDLILRIANFLGFNIKCFLKEVLKGMRVGVSKWIHDWVLWGSQMFEKGMNSKGFGAFLHLRGSYFGAISGRLDLGIFRISKTLSRQNGFWPVLKLTRGRPSIPRCVLL